jgi:hypothetical protein
MPQKYAGDRSPDNTGNFTVMMRIIETLLLRGKLGPFACPENGPQNVFSQLGCKRSFIQYNPARRRRNYRPAQYLAPGTPYPQHLALAY